MRVLHVLDHGLPLHSGYAFRTRAILKAQIARGWQVAAVTGPRQGLTAYDEEVVDGLQFYRTHPMPPARPLIAEWREINAFSARVGEAADVFQPDLIHAHSPLLGGYAARRVARRRDVPFVYEIRAFWEDAAVSNGTLKEDSPKYRLIRAAETRLARKADAVAVICEGLRGDLISRGIDARKIFVSPNGVDMEMFGAPQHYDTALAAELGLHDADTIGFIGSFYDYEGLDDLIAAMPRLVAFRPRMQLLLVGGGPAEAELRRQASASSVSSHIRFIGRVPHDQVERYYSLIDVLVYPRKRMRLTDLVTPLKPLEAMAQRRLVAASDVGGHRELIRHGDTGTLFPPNEPEAIARLLDGLFADRELWEARRNRARAFVEAERNWALNVGRYEPVYRRLIGGDGLEASWSQASHASA